MKRLSLSRKFYDVTQTLEMLHYAVVHDLILLSSVVPVMRRNDPSEITIGAIRISMEKDLSQQ
jgi:hypothetical protein